MRLTVETGKIKWDRFLHVPNITHNLVYVSGLCNNGHVALFTRNDCVIKMGKTVVGVRKDINGIYACIL